MSLKGYKCLTFFKGLLHRLMACWGTKKSEEEVVVHIIKVQTRDGDRVLLTLQVELTDSEGVSDLKKIDQKGV